MNPTAATIKSILLSTTLDKVDAKVLLGYLIDKHFQWPKSFLISHDQDLLSASFMADWYHLESRRIHGEPIAYLIGSKPFHAIDLNITPDVLIPRPETELLVSQGINILQAFFKTSKNFPNNPLRVLDLGCGSGAIILAIAKAFEPSDFFSHIKWYACDISIDALAVAKNNARTLGLQNNVEFSQSDWLTEYTSLQFDVILSNPPYIPKGDPHLSQGDLRFEPSIALTDFADGLTAYRHISQQAYNRLNPQGYLLFEHGFNQASELEQILINAGFIHVLTIKDYSGLDRVTISQKG